MKKGRSIFLYSCLGIFLLVFGINFLTQLTDLGYDGYGEFLKDSDKYEVLFLGNSHMGCAVLPMELWHDQGIASYNLASPGNPMPVTYWMMKHALHDADPQVVVIDCYKVLWNQKIDNKELLHAQTDSLPLTADKMRMICDLLEKPEDRLEFIWNFAVYHDRWWDLDQADFEKGVYIKQSAGDRYKVAPPGEIAEKPDEKVEFSTVGTAYLRSMIEECQSRDIEVLLVYLPFPDIDGEGWQEAFCTERIAEEYGVSCINFFDLQVVDFASDCYDASSHLNASGGKKITRYLGQYLDEHYDVADHRGEAEYADWDADYRQYTEDKLKTLEQMESLDSTLVMLADQSFDCCIYVNGEADIWGQNEMYLPLMENIAGGETEKLRQAVAEGRDYLLIVDNQGGGVFESVDREQFSKECSLGKLFFDVDENDEGRLCLRDRQGRELPESSQADTEAVRIFAMNNQGDGTVLTKGFDLEETMKLAE